MGASGLETIKNYYATRSEVDWGSLTAWHRHCAII